MELIRQPENSNTCGHCCVAMVSGIPVEGVEVLIGHKKGTKTKELVAALDFLKVPNAKKLKRVKSPSELPGVAILVTRPVDKKRGGWHWVTLKNGQIFCPSQGVFGLTEYLEKFGIKASSYLEITA